MAVVGHAYVVVHAITDSVAGEITSAFSGQKIRRAAEYGGEDLSNGILRGFSRAFANDKNNAFSKFARQFDELYPEADRLRRTFVKLNRTGMVVQSGLGALVGSLGAVVGAAGALLGPLAGLVSSFGALGSAAITARVGLGVAQYALGGVAAAVKNATKETSGYGMSVEELREALQQLKFDQEEAEISVDRAALNMEKAYKTMLRTQDLAPSSLLRRDAEIAFREAELAYRKAKDREADLANGTIDPGGGGAATDPFADLTPSQRAFAEYLVSINDIFKDLRESAANGFLPLLQSQIQRLLDSNVMDVLETRFYQIGQGAGLAVARFVDVLMSNNNLANFNIVLGQMAVILPRFGTIAGNIFDALLSTLTALNPVTTRFVDFLERKTGSLARFLDIKNANGQLTAFFDRAGQIAADFGAFFGGVFNGFGDMIAANFGPGSPGDTLLGWLKKVGEGFANKDLVGLDKYFDGAVDNFIRMAQTLGGAIETIVRAGSSSAVRAFWDTLDRGSYAFDQVVRNFVESGPAFANLLRSLTEVIAILSDAGPVEAFINTLSMAFDGLARFLAQIEPLIKALGPIFGIVSAMTLLFSILGKVIMVFGSFIAIAAKGIGVLGGLSVATTTQTIATTGLTAATKASTAALLTSPVGIVVALAAAVAGLALAVNAVDEANKQKAIEDITNAVNSGTGSIKEASQAAEGMSASYSKVNESLNETNHSWSDAAYNMEHATAVAKESGKNIDAVGSALANFAVTDLAKAQEAFRKYRFEVMEIGDKELLNGMGDFKDALIDQADQLDINIRKTDGTIDVQKLYTFAMGDGEYASRKYAAAQEAVAEAERIVAEEAKRVWDETVKLQQELSTAAVEASGWRSAVSKAYEGVKDKAAKTVEEQKKLDKQLLKDTLKNMSEALGASTEFLDDLAILQKKGLSGAALEVIKSAGEAAPALARAIVDGSQEEFDKFELMADQAALRMSTPFNDARQKLIDAWADGTISGSVFNEISTGLNSATSPENLQTWVKLMNKELDKSPLNLTATVTTGPADFTLRRLYDKWTLNFAGVLKAVETGSVKVDGKAYGGFISGPGGPRSDMIPAMLSNGEYVVNAKSTSRYRALLERINAEGNGGKKFANGGMIGESGAGINIVVNPSRGMNEKELAAAVSRRLAFEIRKGTI